VNAFLPEGVVEIQKHYPDVDALVAAVSRLSGRSEESLIREFCAVLATRIFFLLLDEAGKSTNFDHAVRRVAARLGVPVEQAVSIVRHVGATQANIRNATAAPKLSLSSLPYYERSRLIRTQNGRCAICGWKFSDRHDPERVPTLDHTVPYRLGGEQGSNLQVLCALCNRKKGAWLLAADRGRLWLDNYVYFSDSKSSVCWAFIRDGACRICEMPPSRGRLFAQLRNPLGEPCLDNVESMCENHLNADHVVAY
jgi:5-methylcytosine-specific restriction endonuclease McrA